MSARPNTVRLAIVAATAIGSLALTSTALAATGSVYADSNGNVGAGEVPWNGSSAAHDNVGLDFLVLPSITSDRAHFG